jgi:hypothetical protein
MRQTGNVSARNLYWLVAIVAVGVVVWILSGWVWGVIGAVATLAASEVLERSARRRRGGSAQLRSAIATKRGRSK